MAIKNSEVNLLIGLIVKERASIDGATLAQQKRMRELEYQIADQERIAEEARSAIELAQETIEDVQIESRRLHDRLEQLDRLQEDLENSIGYQGARSYLSPTKAKSR